MASSSVQAPRRSKVRVPGSTSGTLIKRWRQQQPEAWERLTYLYFPLIYDWCRRKGLSAEDSRDVSQNVFLSLSKCTMRFQHNGGTNSFRGWLWGVTNNHIKYHLRRHVDQPVAAGGSHAFRQMAGVAETVAIDEFSEESTSETSDESGFIKRALELLRTDFKEPTWRAFWCTTIEERPAADVAADLGISINAVYLAKSRVLRRLRDEFEGMFEQPK